MMIHLPFPFWTKFSPLISKIRCLATALPQPPFIYSSICPVDGHLLLSSSYCSCMDSISETDILEEKINHAHTPNCKKSE